MDKESSPLGDAGLSRCAGSILADVGIFRPVSMLTVILMPSRARAFSIGWGSLLAWPSHGLAEQLHLRAVWTSPTEVVLSCKNSRALPTLPLA